MQPPPAATPAWRARPFGASAADIDVVFGGDRAGAVTAVLGACLSDADGRNAGTGEAWDWTLNQRLQALLAVRLAAGDTPLDVQAPCANCGEPMALALDLTRLAAPPVAPRFDWRQADGSAVQLRLPRGRDLQNWQAAGITDPAAMVSALIDDVAGEAPGPGYRAPEVWLAAIDDEFEAHDPLTALRLQTDCPACAQPNSIACDLEALLLAGFARVQARLLADVARLAAAFHWSEAQIVALPRWRREHYLRLLDAGGWA